MRRGTKYDRHQVKSSRCKSWIRQNACDDIKKLGCSFKMFVTERRLQRKRVAGLCIYARPIYQLAQCCFKTKLIICVRSQIKQLQMYIAANCFICRLTHGRLSEARRSDISKCMWRPIVNCIGEDQEAFRWWKTSVNQLTISSPVIQAHICRAF